LQLIDRRNSIDKIIAAYHLDRVVPAITRIGFRIYTWKTEQAAGTKYTIWGEATAFDED
jgi:hypothetical protein